MKTRNAWRAMALMLLTLGAVVQAQQAPAPAPQPAAPAVANGDAQATTPTLEAQIAQLKAELARLQGLVQALAQEISAKAQQPTEKPLPQTVKVAVTVTLEDGERMELMSYGEKDVQITAPLIRQSPGDNPVTLIGSVGFMAEYFSTAAEKEKALLKYSVSLTIPYLLGRSERTLQQSAQGEVVLTLGEEKEIARIGKYAVAVTVTRD